MADILSNSVSGLLAVQRALTTTGHNVSNANTEGYSRQTVNLSARTPQFMGNGYVGTGTQVQSITRSFDQYVESQLRDVTSDNSRLQFVSDIASQVTTVLGDTESGIAQSSQAFFGAASDVAANPTDITARQAYLNEASALTDRFNQLDGRLADLNTRIGQQANAISREVNTFAEEVASLNDKISRAYAQDPNALPNDLLDRRDQLVRDIAERVNIRVNDDGAGSLNLAVGSGQSLVTGGAATEFQAINGAAGLTVKIGDKTITERVTGGQLGGMIETQNELITPLRNELGRAALVLAQEANAIQEAGYDLDGNAGTPLFTAIGGFSPSVSVDGRNDGSGSASGSIADATLLTDARYEARFDGTNWSVRSQDDPGTELASVGSGGSTTAIPGLDITFSGTPEAGDVLYIDPAAGAAGQIETTLADPRDVAAAGGDGGGNSLGNRDNTQIEAMAELANRTLVGQTGAGAADGQTLGGALSSAVSNAGSVARTAEMQGESAQASLDNLVARQQSVSGVNLDEEAANLLKYQQQYQALARSISISGNLFQSVLNAVG
ncbi:flagellar hook-associated protein FlgK [Guyparkeria hydrothermalis]|uniref:Flagellar hook-associated protein 1 n=1 Tax=Guyparkeria halophila TaxID=47960 RepID=A0A6I6D1K9_9GAMM|nr:MULTISPECIES: flagellar hook-associated protein FlgK [Guyparkeria]MCL7751550.1 flagellar hook-associated protein FlgK [Guyparkeria hydrothermalis]QGT78017.1 flagellar hook-associated protein FlgK [Guyparkeria halophila]